jgi:DNA repair photolyase
MIKNPIYSPGGRAAEYGEYALNIYDGCSHFCSYCYVPGVLHKTVEQFRKTAMPREGIVEATKRQLAKGTFWNREIFLCFTCDPYPRFCNTDTTREIIKAIKESGSHVRILTKGGLSAERDFDLLDNNDWFGVTYAGYTPDMLDEVTNQSLEEPGAAEPSERLLTLSHAHELGIKTWVSIEPVLDADDILELLARNVGYIDLYKIGKLNHKPSTIDWKEFGNKAEHICKANGYNYCIKNDLRAEMERV